mmetsp:Transcript_27769/g.73386  ORF Transcript_27769/g.73386 Transcript_27769/m.73386 type:complete len:408 (+) Transcript_27769:800-2023(+)
MSVVPPADGRVEPDAVVVELRDARARLRAVLGAEILQDPGAGAQPGDVRHTGLGHAAVQGLHELFHAGVAFGSSRHLARIGQRHVEEERQRRRNAELEEQRGGWGRLVADRSHVHQVLEQGHGDADQPKDWEGLLRSLVLQNGLHEALLLLLLLLLVALALLDVLVQPLVAGAGVELHLLTQFLDQLLHVQVLLALRDLQGGLAVRVAGLGVALLLQEELDDRRLRSTNSSVQGLHLRVVGRREVRAEVVEQPQRQEVPLVGCPVAGRAPVLVRVRDHREVQRLPPVHEHQHGLVAPVLDGNHEGRRPERVPVRHAGLRVEQGSRGLHVAAEHRPHEGRLRVVRLGVHGTAFAEAELDELLVADQGAPVQEAVALVVEGGPVLGVGLQQLDRHAEVLLPGQREDLRS